MEGVRRAAWLGLLALGTAITVLGACHWIAWRDDPPRYWMQDRRVERFLAQSVVTGPLLVAGAIVWRRRRRRPSA